MHPAFIVGMFVFFGDGGKSVPGPAAEMAKIARAYKIELLRTDPGFPVESVWGGKIDGKAAGEAELKRFIRLFSQEFSLYPLDLVKRCKLKRIVFCKELTCRGRGELGGLTDCINGTIYLDVGLLSATTKHYQSRAIHHEMMHIIDFSDERKDSDDERWSALNPADFIYGKQRVGLDDVGLLLFSEDLPGFLDEYSTRNIAEDKAEVFSNLIVVPTYLEYRMKHDATLRAKVGHVKELVAKACPEMKEAFWDTAKQVARPAVDFAPTPRPVRPKNPLKIGTLYVGP
jgi:hypothetical protein